METVIRRRSVAGGLLVLLTAAVDAQPLYSVTPYTAPLSSFIPETGINNAAQLVGQLVTPDETDPIPTLYSNGVMTSIGGRYDTAHAINNLGEVVGSYFDGQTAWIYSNGSMTLLTSLLCSDPECFSNAYGINDLSQIVGFTTLKIGSPEHAYFLDGGTMTDLGTLGGANSTGRAINNEGAIAGDSDTRNGAHHAFLYRNGRMRDIGTLGGDFSQAQAINDNDQMIGFSNLSAGGPQHAFLYHWGRMTDLGTLGGTSSQPLAINAVGQAVGNATTSGNASHAFLYSNGAMLDLNTLIDPVTAAQLTLTNAYGINDNGLITVAGVDSTSGRSSGYLLTPLTPLAPTDLVARPRSAQTVLLKWTGAAGASSYSVYVGTAPGGESSTPVKTGITGTRTYITGLTSGSTCYFTVAAVNANGTGLPSNEAHVTVK